MAKTRHSASAKTRRKKASREKAVRKTARPKEARQKTVAPAVPPVELLKIRLKSCTANNNLGKGTLPPYVDTHANITVNIDREAGQVHVLPSIQAIARYEDTAAELPPVDMPLFIHATFSLTYSAKSLEGISDEHINAFSMQTSFFCVWPYWREFVASTVSRMGLPALTVPLLSVSQVQEEVRAAVLAQEASRPQTRRKK
ncbi:MAG: hypothetical protein H8E73_08340 [Planctomycetes bacterium]|nr:hypothetical protein [Planctomycetota bacterium]